MIRFSLFSFILALTGSLSANAAGILVPLDVLSAEVLTASLCRLPLLPQVKKNQALAELVRRYDRDLLKGYYLPQSFTSGYYTRRIEPYLSKPSYQADPSGHLFRGMYVRVQELAAVLSEGMTLDKVSWTVGVGKQLSFSSSDREAMSYIFHNARSYDDGIGIVVAVKLSSDFKPLVDSALNSTGTIYSLARDLKSKEILQVYLFGEHGLESLENIFRKMSEGKMKSASSWNQVFVDAPGSGSVGGGKR